MRFETIEAAVGTNVLRAVVEGDVLFDEAVFCKGGSEGAMCGAQGEAVRTGSGKVVFFVFILVFVVYLGFHIQIPVGSWLLVSLRRGSAEERTRWQS